MDSFEKIWKEAPKLERILKNFEKYLAHTRLYKTSETETLTEHTELVINYFLRVMNVNGIEQLIDGMIDELTKNDKIINSNKCSDFIKILFFASVYFHDFGKINENFQKEIMKNKLFENVQNAIGTHHSKLGAYIYIVYHLNLINDPVFSPDEQCLLCSLCIFFSYSIIKHHSSYLNKLEDEINFDEKTVCSFSNYLQNYSIECIEKLKIIIPQNIASIITDSFGNLSLNKNYLVFILIKLNYSLLTASDYYATSHFMNELDLIESDFGIINNSFRDKIISNIKITKKYNKAINSDYCQIENKSLDDLQDISPDNLNVLRQKMAIEVIKNVNEHYRNNLFYIEAPTGGGKTNLSILSAIELIKRDERINKIVYVFPFTTLITQTYKTLKDTLGLDENELIEIHSKTGFKIKSNTENVEEYDIEEEKDGLYGNLKLNHIENLFVNYPVCLLTHIKFFDILKTNRKEINYLFHRLANSIVIIDELQSYDPSEWDKIIYFIDLLSKCMNIKFILMSATLPKIDSLSSRTYDNPFIELITNSKEKYFLNPNFKSRIEFNFELLNRIIDINYLCELVYTKSKEYEEQQNKGVKSVIEFIYKKTASQFYLAFKKSVYSKYYDNIFLLSGTILEPRRREIINYLKNHENKNKNILLVSTQVIEAGVDIDMDIGFKDRSIIDSEEQLAGRVNRNMEKYGCKVYLFDLDKEFRIYGNDLRYRMMRDINNDDYKNILLNKKFDELYTKVNNQINKINTFEHVVNFNTYSDYINKIDFIKVNNNFKLIANDSTETFFVPINIPVKVISEDNKFDKIFTDNELQFLKEKHCYFDNEEYINGGSIWELYVNIITNKNNNFILKSIEYKIMLGIITKFTFSVFKNLNSLKDLKIKTCSEEKYGFTYVANFDNYYSYENGIDDSNLDNSNFI